MGFGRESICLLLYKRGLISDFERHRNVSLKFALVSFFVHSIKRLGEANISNIIYHLSGLLFL